MECLKDSYSIATFGKVSGTGQSGRTTADNCHFMTIKFCFLQRLFTVMHVPVRSESLQPPNADRFAFFPTDTLTFTLPFLRTYSATDCRETAGQVNGFISTFIVMFCNFLNKFRNADIHRTAGNTGHVLAVQTACCFFFCHFGSIAECNFFKIMRTDSGLLFRNRHFCL